MNFCVACIVCFLFILYFLFFFKQKTAYEMRISDWSSDVCSSDLMTLLPMDDPQATMFDGPNSQFLRNLPKAPPNRSTNPFDKENRRDTLLAVGAGMMRGGNLGERMANAADAILSPRQHLRSRTVNSVSTAGRGSVCQYV